MRISVAIVEDHPVFAAALSQLLAGVGWHVAFVATTVDDARAGLREHEPDVVLLDVALPDGDGFSLVSEQITSRGDDSPVPAFIGLSSHDDTRTVAAAERAGCRGFVSKTAAPSHIVAAVRQVVGGGTAFDIRPSASPERSQIALSPREVACLALVAEGLSNRAIADVLGISVETVKTHLESVRSKLGAADRAQAVAIGVRLGLV